MTTLKLNYIKNPWITELQSKMNSEDLDIYLNDLLNLGYHLSKTTKITVNEDNILKPINDKFKLISENYDKLDTIESSIIEEMQDIRNKITTTLETESKQTQNQCENLNQAILKLTGNVSTSSLKGRIGEEFISNLLKHNFPDDTVNETNKNSHESDIHLISSIYPTTLIESKLYSHCVNSNEIDKFLSDLEETGINYGIFISLTSPIIKHRRLEYKYINDKHIIFLPNAGFDGFNIIYGIIFLREISKMFSKNSISRELFDEKSNEIKNIIEDFELSYNQISKLKNRAMEFKSSVDKQLLTLTMDICESEIIVKNMFEKTKKNIIDALTIGKYTLIEDDLFDDFIKKYACSNNKIRKIISNYFQLLKDHNYHLLKNDDKDDNLQFSNTKSTISLKIMKTKAIFDFSNGIKCEVKDNCSDITQFKQIINLI